MAKEIIARIIDLVAQAQDLARAIDIPNLLQPGLVKEMIIAQCLGHRLIPAKRGADACNFNDSTILFEYLSCKEGGTGQLDRVYKQPRKKRIESLKRVSRNRKIYFAVFFRDDQLRLKAIYEIDPAVVLKETKRKLKRSSNKISHVGFSIKWAIQNGKIVYEDKNCGKP